MNVAHCGAFLALLCFLLCTFNLASATPPPPTAQQSCNVRVPAGAASQPYSNCTQYCCASGVVSAYSANALVGCCHDAALDTCPLGMKCCGPATAPATAGQQSRDCYSDAQQGCCQWKAVTGFDTTTNSLTFSNMAQTFFKDTQQCCATAGGSTMMSNGNNPIAPKWVTSCAQWLLDQSTPILCKDNSSCPTIDNVQMACCRRPAQTQPTSETQYDNNGIGNCYDPRYKSCCGGLETGGSRQIGENFKSNYTYADPVVFDPITAQCCKIPLQSGGESFAVSLTRRCPCMASADCPTAAHTCCAPTDVELQANTNTQGKRLMKCDPGCPTTGLNAAAAGYPYFAGCLGQCIAPTGTSNTFTAEVCLSGATFQNRCDNARWRNGGSLTVPSGDSLIVQEWQTHEMDCCASNPTDTVNSYSIVYNTRTEVCCPVIGTSRRDKNGNLIGRYLSKVVPWQSDMNNLDACMCLTDDDCPGAQKCCLNANYQFASGASNLQYKGYNGLCFDPKITDCCSYKSQTTNVTTTAAITVSTLYNPNTAVCCPTGGVASDLTSCKCHSDSECPGPYGACCMATVRVANASHNAGTCIDSRYWSCCHFDQVDGHNRPYYNKDVAFQPTQAAPYNNATQVCCPWGGVGSSVQDCNCRYGTTGDCPGSSQCCAGNNAALAPGEFKFSDWGACFNPENEACCDYKWRGKGSSPDIYDKKVEVCCPLNGVAHDHRSCGCAGNSDCPTDGACCTDAEAASAGIDTDCRWNFDNCRGRCVHTKIETCCDNPKVSEWAMNSNAVSTKACAAEFQKCCDGQCCNKATQTCKAGVVNSRIHSLTTMAWSTYDGNNVGYHFGLDEEQMKCTTLEHSSPSIVFHTWVFPTFLSIACIVFMVLGTKAAFGTDISPNVLKLGLVGLEIFVGIMSLLLLWSPLWKYGFVIVVANTVILTSFAVPGVWTRRFAVVVAVVCFLWVVEPFGSNSILNFGTTTFAGGQHNNDGGAQGAWYNAHGLNYAARLLQRPREEFNPDDYEDACTLFYQYWRVDPMLHDHRTWNPASPTRGICRRSWMHTITVMAGLITPFQTVFLLLAGLAIARATPATKDMKVQPLA